MDEQEIHEQEAFDRAMERKRKRAAEVAEIRDRVLKTMCPTYSSSGGDQGIQGRISADDFSTLMRLLGADQ